jgi:hypothetical protein
LAPIVGSTSEEKDKANIQILAQWLGLFQALLQAPAQHTWAKQLLETGFLQLLLADGQWGASISLSGKFLQSAQHTTCNCLGT